MHLPGLRLPGTFFHILVWHFPKVHPSQCVYLSSTSRHIDVIHLVLSVSAKVNVSLRLAEDEPEL